MKPSVFALKYITSQQYGTRNIKGEKIDFVVVKTKSGKLFALHADEEELFIRAFAEGINCERNLSGIFGAAFSTLYERIKKRFSDFDEIKDNELRATAYLLETAYGRMKDESDEIFGYPVCLDNINREGRPRWHKSVKPSFRDVLKDIFR